MHEELPHLLRLVGTAGRDALLGELVAQAESRPPDGLKALVFAAILAGLTDSPPLLGPIESVVKGDATLSAVWRSNPDSEPASFPPAASDPRRVAHEVGAFLTHADKYRCTDCGFAGRQFYWHCPACHAWDSFEMHATVKLG
jgi:hypothetical protein